MTKKIIASICMLALLVGLLPLTSIQTHAAVALDSGNTYQVGYAKVDLNPYVIEGDPSSGIMALPLAGVGDNWNRLSKDSLIDDNGDGVIDENDGIKGTCIAISDSEGNTVLLITVDLLSGYLNSQVRADIVESVNAAIANGELTDTKEISIDNIYYSGTHTHNSIAATSYAKGGKTGTNDDGVDLSVVNENLGIWIERTQRYLCQMALDALKDRSAATLTKDQLAVSDATSEAVVGKRLQSTRHYWIDVDGDKFVGGNGFNAVDKWDYANPDDYRTTRGVDPKQFTRAEEIIKLLRFSFEDENKLPVVYASWASHPSKNNSDTYEGSSKLSVSGDYVVAFCHALEYGVDITIDPANGYLLGWNYGTTRKYRAAFFQADGGNVNGGSDELVTYSGSDGDVEQYGSDWYQQSAKNGPVKNSGSNYGVVLAQLAAECLTDGKNEVLSDGGPIQIMTKTYNAAKKTIGISQLAYQAALAYQEANAIKTVGLPYKYTDPDTNEVFLIASRFHASNLISYWDETIAAPIGGTYNLTLNTLMLGKNVAFVTMPGETFNFYYKDTALTGEAKYAQENNLWHELADEAAYGEVFVISHCNGYVGYIPNDEAYVYNLGSTKWANGSYEAHSSKFEQGTGEEILRLYDQMLTALSNQDTDLSYTGPCEYCGEDQLWQPYSAQTTLNSGHYYLCSNIYTANIKINGGQTVCLDLNGHILRGETRAFALSDSNKDILNIMDSSASQTGQVQGYGALYGAGRGLYGGTINIAAGDEVNLYSGTLTYVDRTAYSVLRGGVLYVSGTFNMYGGKVIGGTASSFTGSYYSNGVVSATKTAYGGTIYNTGTCNFYGGSVSGGKTNSLVGTVTTTESSYTYAETETILEDHGACIWNAAAGQVTLGGNAQLEHLHFAGSEGLTVVGKFTGSAQVRYNTLTELPDLTKVGDAVDADVSQGQITFTDAPGKVAAVKDSELVIADRSDSYEICEACGSCQWIPVTQAELKAFGMSNMVPGHYRLVEDVKVDMKRLNENGDHPGTFCIDLAGHSYTSTSRPFAVFAEASLNIFDSVGGGVIMGNCTASTYGGALYVYPSGTATLYNGTLKHSDTEIAHGGVVSINGGSFYMHGGKIEGASVSGKGGAVLVSSRSGVYGSLTVTGGEITMGQAQDSGACVHALSSCEINISGDAKIDRITFNGSTADTLNITGDFTGSVELEYPDSVVLEELTDIGNAQGTVHFADISFVNVEGMTAAVKDGDLVASSSSDPFGNCEVCGECRWTLVTQEELKAFGTSDMLPGHYLLAEDVKVDLKRLNENGDHPGTFCIDLAGHTYTGSSRPFAVCAGASLNIFDSVGGGSIVGNSGSSVSGGVLYLYPNSTAALYGGTLKHNKTTIATGGVVCVSGGSFYMHGGKIEGGSVSGNGGAISVMLNKSYGSLTVTGGQIITGNAANGNCIHVVKGCSVSLSGTAQIDEIYFAGTSAQYLSMENFAGSVTLHYSDSMNLSSGTVLGTVSSELTGVVQLVATCKTVIVNENTLVVQDAHDYVPVTTDPDCTEQGYTTYTCTVCSDSYVTDEVDAKGHSYTSVTVDPTCTATGSVTRICAVCGDTQVETIPANGHNYETVVTAPTCTVPGFSTYTCTVCNDSFVADETEATGHQYVGGVCSGCDLCQGCGESQWTLLTADGLKEIGTSLKSGHYRLAEDIETSQLTVSGTCCIDLAGYTLTGTTRAFYVAGGATLHILDSVGSGILEGKSDASVTGGVIYIYADAVMNVYGGTLRHNTANSETVTTGGVACISGGTLNFYGGIMEGANVTGYGGAVMVSSRSGKYGLLNVTGGRITSGTAGGAGGCVYVNTGCSINLSNDAQVERIRFAGESENALKITGPFSGQTVLQYSGSATIEQGKVVGYVENSELIHGSVTIWNAACTEVMIDGEALIVNFIHDYQRVTVEVTCTTDGSITDTCSVCGDVQVQTFPAAGHSNETVTVDPTCTVDGSITVTCTTCGESTVGVIPALGHSFIDGICSVCGEADPEYIKPVVQPTLTLKAPTLEFKDMICVIAFYTAENTEDVVEMGMITYKNKVDAWNVETADYVIPGATFDESTGRYFSSSQGIHAKYLGDTVYLACYAKLSNGSYVYTKLAPYSPITYATNQLKNSTNTELKQLVSAMLNYGAAAQVYFVHNTDNLANAGMTAEQLALPEEYRADMIQAVPAADQAKQGVFYNNKGFSKRSPAVSFEGAFSINYFFTPAYVPVGEITFYYWNEADFGAADVLTPENASGSFAMSGEGQGQYRGDIVGIAAKDLGNAVYVAAIYTDGTNTWTSGVLGYSIGAYCANQATKGGTMADLAMATAVYGYHAKLYFN